MRFLRILTKKSRQLLVGGAVLVAIAVVWLGLALPRLVEAHRLSRNMDKEPINPMMPPEYIRQIEHDREEVRSELRFWTGVAFAGALVLLVGAYCSATGARSSVGPTTRKGAPR